MRPRFKLCEHAASRIHVLSAFMANGYENREWKALLDVPVTFTTTFDNIFLDRASKWLTVCALFIDTAVLVGWWLGAILTLLDKVQETDLRWEIIVNWVARSKGVKSGY